MSNISTSSIQSSVIEQRGQREHFRAAWRQQLERQRVMLVMCALHQRNAYQHYSVLTRNLVVGKLQQP